MESQKTSSSQQPYTVLNSKNSKPCNNIAFSLTDPKLLATGFDKKGSEYGLLIWDVDKTKMSSSSEDKGYGGGVPETLNRTNSIVNFDRDPVFSRRVGEDTFPLGILTIRFKLIKIFLSLFFYVTSFLIDMARFKFAAYDPPLVPKPLPPVR